MPGNEALRVVRDLGNRQEGDRSVGERLRAETRETGIPRLAVWRPSRAVSVGPRDRSADGYDRAVQAACDRGYPVVNRAMGGRPVVMGPSTMGFVWATPTAESSLEGRYTRVQSTLRDALTAVDVTAWPGEPPGSFCPGAHGLRARGYKIAGFAQRVQSDVAAVGGILIIESEEEISSVLQVIYEALDLPFDPDTVGSVGRVGGRTDPHTVRDAVIEAFRDRTI